MVWIAFNAFLCASLKYLILLWSADDCGWFSGLVFVLFVVLCGLLDLRWRVWVWFDLVACWFWVWCTCLFVLVCVTLCLVAVGFVYCVGLRFCCCCLLWWELFVL